MIQSAKPIYRFAPSPNGELHLGHAYSALLNLKLARETGGKILLRIEDIDTVRCTPQLEKQMLEDLEWIGFEWDEKPRRQSEHFDDYRAELETLSHMQLIYPATLSRGEIRKRITQLEADGSIWPKDPDGSPHYPGDERDFDAVAQARIIASENSHTLRLNMARSLATLAEPLTWTEVADNTTRTVPCNPEDWGDVVLARKDTPASYHLCCVVDDALQGITHIVRGQDLFHATAVHRLLQTLLDLPEPIYHHHRLILDETGRKLSKSNADTSLRQLRMAGRSAQDIKGMLFENDD